MKTEITAHPSPKGSKKAKAVKKTVKPAEPVEPVPGYRGLIALALNSGQVTSINVQAVHRNDRFDYAYGLNERLEHVPAEGDRGDITYFYAYVKLKDGGHGFEVLSKAEVGTGSAEKGKEIAIRRLVPYLPLAVREAAALEEIQEIVADLPEPVLNAPAEEPVYPAPQAVDLSEEELAGLFPPGHVMRILDAASERDMPDEVLAEIAGAPLEEISPEDEPWILRAIASWRH